MIAALSRNHVIGRDGGLPFHLPRDLRHFKRMTLGKPCIMGRGTFESVGCKPLKKRFNIILSRSLSQVPEGVGLARTPEEALRLAADAPEVMVCGGESVYAAFLPLADRLYLTWVDTELEGDTRFPAFDPSTWRELSREDHAADERHAWAFSFVTLERVR